MDSILSRFKFCGLVVLFLMSSSAAKADDDLASLRQQADAVISHDGPEARTQISTVFKAADALADAGQLEAADHYYLAGLRVDSHDFEHHLKYSQLLVRENKKPESAVQAKIVLEGSEDTDQVAKAQKILGIAPVEITPFDPQSASDNAFHIILVPIGDIDTELLRKEQILLHDQLNIDVQIHFLPVKLGKPARNSVHPQAEAIRKGLEQFSTKNQAGFSKALDSAGMSEDDLKDDAKLMKFAIKLMQSEGEETKARQMKAFAAHAVDQWSAEEILQDLISTVPSSTSNHVRFIGVTRVDIFSKPTNYLFGWAQGYGAVVSYNRFTASFNSEIPNRSRLLRRFNFQCLSSAGRLFGIPACTDPSCPRCYPNDLAEEDAKSDKLCDICRDNFKKVLGGN